MQIEEIKIFLDEKVKKYNQPAFIADDPISIPHLFSKKEDIEIAAFMVATIAWGRRDLILKSASNLMRILKHQPYDFLINADEHDWIELENFYYRTFSAVDGTYFLKALRCIYLEHGGLETLFMDGYQNGGLKHAISHFRDVFLSFDAPQRTHKHVANVKKGSSAKRINMFLRWMVRNDNKGVDFGLWKGISAADLLLPLDLHTGNVSRHLGILTRKQNDMKAVEEVMETLRIFDPLDPVKYDFALFSLGVNEQF